MKKILLIFALIISNIIFAQNDEAFVDSLVAQKMAELEMNDNPEYFFRKGYCDGNSQMIILPSGKICTSESTYYTTYVFWKGENEKMTVQKFDNCGSFKPIILGFNKVIAKSLKEKQALKTGEVKPNNEDKIGENSIGDRVVKSCHTQYKFVFAKDVFEKNLKESDLTKDSKYKNENLKYNQSLQLISLDTELTKLLQNLEETGRFRREN